MQDRRLVQIYYQQKIANCESNDHVTDDVMWPKNVTESTDKTKTIHKVNKYKISVFLSETWHARAL